MMKLLAGPVCNFSAKVRLAIFEKGLAVETEEVPYSLKQGYSPKHPLVLAISPKGSVPVLLADDLAIYDSTVILEYLEDRYPQPALYPEEPGQRARCRQLEAEADEMLWPLVRALRGALASDDPAAIAAARRDVHDFYRRLDTGLKDGPFLCGVFSAADIATWILVHLLEGLDCGPDDGTPLTQRWYQRVTERPAFMRLIEQRRANLQRLGALPSPAAPASESAAPFCTKPD
jgi:glutathione S-transferase